MERYSTLWGTDKAGVYGRQGASKGLSAFLTNKIGGSNVKDVVSLTEKILSGFKALPGYELENLDNKPLAVVYAPMYLKNKPGMPTTMKGFCALSVNGMENRAGRKESNYAHTFFFSQQEMLSAGEYNYLDLLMGTYQVTARDVKGHRDGTSRIHFEQAPAKVSPVRRAQDLPCVVKAIDSIYQNKNVVIVLEEGVSFNRRAMEILTQLYSMMQPALATETGFATYQTVDRIQELSAETNVQVYVVPAGVELSKLSAGKFEILNLAAGRVVPEQTPLTMTLLEWDKFDWSYRREAMEHLFAKNSDYLNAEEFVKLSRQFFAQVQDLNTWLTDTSKHGTVTTIEALAAEDKTQTGWKLVPWAKKAFESKVPALLKNTSLDALNAQNVALVYEYDGADARLKKLSASDGSDAAARQKAARDFQYGRKLAGISEAVLCQKIWEKAEARVSPAYKAEIQIRDEKIQSADAAHQKAMADKDAAHAEEITGLNTAHAAALTAAEEAKQTAVAAEKANTAAVQAKLDDADRVWGEKLNKLNADYTAAMAAKDTAHTEAVAKLNDDHTAAMAAKDTAHAADLKAAEDAKSAAVAAEAGKTAAVQAKLDQAVADLEEAKKAYVAQGEELSKAKNAAIKRKQKNEAYEAEIARLNNLLIAEGKDPTPPAPPKPKEPTMTMLGVEMPKSAMKVIAIFAAAALIIGAIVSGVIVGALSGGKDDPDGTTPPTTTAPVETSTAPPETTVPPTTVPETTVPPTAEPPVQSALLEDGSVNWDVVLENVTWAADVETEAEAMETLLPDYRIELEGWSLEAVVTPLAWPAEGEDAEAVPYITVLKRDAEAEEPDLASLGEASLALLAGERCVCMYGVDGDAMEAILELTRLITPESGELRQFSCALEDGTALDLTAILAESDWRKVTKISFDEDSLIKMQNDLGTGRTPVILLEGVDGGAAAYDYTDNPEKALELQGILTGNGHTALVQDDFVLVLASAEALTNGENP